MSDVTSVLKRADVAVEEEKRAIYVSASGNNSWLKVSNAKRDHKAEIIVVLQLIIFTSCGGVSCIRIQDRVPPSTGPLERFAEKCKKCFPYRFKIPHLEA